MDISWHAIASDSGFLLAQSLAAIAFLIGIVGYQIQSRRKMLLVWAIAAAVNGLHFLQLGRPDAGGLALLIAVRQLVAAHVTNKIVMVLFLLLALPYLWATSDGAESILILIATLIGTVASFQEDRKRMRLLLFVATSCWMTYNIIVGSPVAVLMEISGMASNALGYYKLTREEATGNNEVKAA